MTETADYDCEASVDLAAHLVDPDVHLLYHPNAHKIDDTYISSQFSGTLATTLSLAADKLYVVPIYIPKSYDITVIGCKVTLTYAGTHRLGIYYDSGEMYPGDLLLDAGTFNSGTTGTKQIAIDIQLTRGIYHLALFSNGTPAVTAGASSNLLVIPGQSDYTISPPIFWVATLAYGALPDPYPSGATPTRGGHPLMLLK